MQENPTIQTRHVKWLNQQVEKEEKNEDDESISTRI